MKPTHEIWPDGTQRWRLNGVIHREDGPAMIHDDGSVEYRAFGHRYISLEELQIGVILDR